MDIFKKEVLKIHKKKIVKSVYYIKILSEIEIHLMILYNGGRINEFE